MSSIEYVCENNAYVGYNLLVTSIIIDLFCCAYFIYRLMTFYKAGKIIFKVEDLSNKISIIKREELIFINSVFGITCTLFPAVIRYSLHLGNFGPDAIRIFQILFFMATQGYAFISWYMDNCIGLLKLFISTTILLLILTVSDYVYMKECIYIFLLILIPIYVRSKCNCYHTENKILIVIFKIYHILSIYSVLHVSYIRPCVYQTNIILLIFVTIPLLLTNILYKTHIPNEIIPTRFENYNNTDLETKIVNKKS